MNTQEIEQLYQHYSNSNPDTPQLSAEALAFLADQRRNDQAKQRRTEVIDELARAERKAFQDRWLAWRDDVKQLFSNRKAPNGYKRGGTLLVQLTDVHFGSKQNRPNRAGMSMSIASQRLRLYAERVKDYAACFGATKLVIALTGDLVDSRNGKDRMDKVANHESCQTLAKEQGLDLLIMFITDLYESGQFESVGIYGVNGNEARITYDITYGETTVPENFDSLMHSGLYRQFSKNPDFTFGFNPASVIVPVEDLKVYLVHGHTAEFGKSKMTQEHLRAVLDKNGCDFGISGHIHYPITTGDWSRSGSLSGEDCFAGDGLGYKSSRATQTILHVQGRNRSVITVDLENPEGIEGYPLCTYGGAFGVLENQYSRT